MADVLSEKLDVRESLDKARLVTKRLVELIGLVQDGDSTSDKRALREDAHTFLKVSLEQRTSWVPLAYIIRTDGRPTVQHDQDVRRPARAVWHAACQDGPAHERDDRVRDPPARLLPPHALEQWQYLADTESDSPLLPHGHARIHLRVRRPD